MLFFTVLCSERLVIPGAITIVVVVGNRTSNPLSARVASDDANALSIRFQDRLNGAGIVELKEVARPERPGMPPLGTFTRNAGSAGLPTRTTAHWTPV